MAKIKAKIINRGLPFIPDMSAYVYADSRRDFRLGKFRTLLRVRDCILEVSEWPRDRKGNPLKPGSLLDPAWVAACLQGIRRKDAAPATAPTPEQQAADARIELVRAYLAAQP